MRSCDTGPERRLISMQMSADTKECLSTDRQQGPESYCPAGTRRARKSLGIDQHAGAMGHSMTYPDTQKTPGSSWWRYHSLMPKPNLVLRVPTVGLTVALCAILLACGSRVGPGEAPPARLHTLTGDIIELQSLDGPVLVNFWSPTCVVCLQEMPAMAELYDDYAGAGFELIAVAMPHDPPNEVLELAKARKLPFPVAIDIEGKVLEQFEPVRGTPTSYLFDADGTTVARHVGAMDIRALRDQLDGML